MHLSSLKLTQFRNYPALTLELTPGISVLVGPNAQGKTNLLEAIFMLVLGKSFRGASAEEQIQHGKDFARIEGTVQTKSDHLRLEVILDGTQGKRPSKRIKIEGVPHRITEIIGKFHAVVFQPDDLNVIALSPSYRRDHINTTLSQVSKEYARTLSTYEKILRSRNKLLEGIREGTAQEKELPYWNDQLISLATTLVAYRHALLDQYKNLVSTLYGKISKQSDKFEIAYQACVTHPEEVATEYEQKLIDNLNRDIASGTTTSGPHREDVSFTLNEKPVASFGSRGEQRSAMLALKLAEIEYIKEKTGTTPVLLLDDVFSELDESRREQLLTIANPEQTIITTTDEKYIHGDVTVYRVSNGAID